MRATLALFIEASCKVSRSAALIAVVILAIFSTLIAPFVQKAASKGFHCGIDMRDHTLIIGYGRTSSRIASLLELTGKKFIVIDSNMGKVSYLEPAEDLGENHGDDEYEEERQ